MAISMETKDIDRKEVGGAEQKPQGTQDAQVQTFRCNDCGNVIYKHEVFCSKCGKLLDRYDFE